MLNTTPARLQDGWLIANPEEAYLDLKWLSEITQAINNGYEYPNVHAVLIEHAGRLVYELYLDGEDGHYGDREFNVNSLHDLRSISKSITSLLLGIALGGNYEQALKTPVTNFIKGVDSSVVEGTRAITLHHVLTMTAGFEWDQWSVPYSDPQNDETKLYRSKDPVGFTLSRPVVHAPGSVWTYNSGLTELLVTIIEQKTNTRLRKFASDNLFGPLDIDNFEWWGGWHWEPKGRPSSAAGLRMRARDLAKIGSLILHNGFWKGRQIIPSKWTQLVGKRHVKEAPAGERIYGYGYQWWSGIPGAIPPYSVIGGFGLGGQRLLIVPEHHLVVTVFAGNYDSHQQDMGNRIMHRVVSAHRNHG